MNVETHIYVTLDENGEPVAAYRTIGEARKAVESDSYTHEEEREYVPDVPLCDLLSGFEGIVVSTDPFVVDDGQEQRTVDDIDEHHSLEIGEAVAVDRDGIRTLDYNPVDGKDVTNIDYNLTDSEVNPDR